MIYVAAMLLVFFLAVGVGAVAALMLSREPERDASNSTSTAESRTFEDTVLETTSITKKTLEDTGIETTNHTKRANPPQKPAQEASFVHKATDKNSRGDYTYLSNPSINGDPNAIVLVRPISDRGSTSGTTYKHNIGVWYEPVAKKWAIFNQDRAAVPSGVTFRVIVPPASERFIHRAELINTVGNTTYLDDPLTNSNPDVVLSVTQNWNPGGGRGIYNNHPIGILYDKDLKKWAIYNRDDEPMPDGASFNVAVSEGVKSGK